MRKFCIAFFVLAIMLGVSMQVGYAMDCTQDTMFDKMGDWAATMGKKGVDKDAVLAKRKADRLAICAKKQAQEAAKAVEKAGKELKKKLGL